MGITKRFVEWLKNPCTWGRHNYATIRQGTCKAWMGSLFHEPVRVTCYVYVNQCQCCSKKVAGMKNPHASAKLDPEETIRNLNWSRQYT
jgi:hypothetical protein